MSIRRCPHEIYWPENDRNCSLEHFVTFEF
jgi:hypothetical protein